MNTLAFDTHAFVKRLTGAGMPEAQAEVLADEQRRLIDHRLAQIKGELGIEIAEAKVDILKWMVYLAMGLQTIVILGAVFALGRFGH